MLKIQYRESRARYGFVVLHHGKRRPYFRWKTEAEAEAAYHKMALEPEKEGPKPVRAHPLGEVAKDFIDDAESNKSKWRFDSVHWNFDSTILPYFGGNTPVTHINCENIEEFIECQKARLVRGKPIKNKTVWHYIADIRSMYNWGLKKTRRFNATQGRSGTNYGIEINPVDDANLKPIADRKPRKVEIPAELVEQAAGVLGGRERILFDLYRFLGFRKDEGNRLQWSDIDLEKGGLWVPGTKNLYAAAPLPMPDILRRYFRELRVIADPDCPWVFPGNSGRTKGKKIYSRANMFKNIQRRTGGTSTPYYRLVKKTGKHKIDYHVTGGIQLTTRNLRDYFATEVCSKIDDPNTLMRLMRHNSLSTSTLYLRPVQRRMAAAVKGLGE